jgi:ribonucleoside-diphosphate reductase alpha chain
MSDLFNALFGSNNLKSDSSKDVIEYKYKGDIKKEEEKADVLKNASLLHVRETSRPYETFEKVEPLVEEKAQSKKNTKYNEDIYVKNVNSEQMIAYNPEDVLAKATEYFNGDEMVANVWMNKYALRDGAGNIYELSPDDMHLRLSREFARIEKKYPNPLDEIKINMLLKHFRYIVPQGSPMFGIGNDFQIASLSNCFVIGNVGNSDSYGGIMKIDEEQVQLMKRRGGVGHDLSHIRPEGSLVNNSALTSTGIVPFMERYSNSTREVAQGGRRGALMLSISIKHPDVDKFIDAKLTQGKITGANISVKIDDEFMECVKSGKPYIQQYPIDSPNPQFRKEVDAKALWNKIIHNAWQSAEPGILFWDTIKKEAIPDCYKDQGFATVSTNPCGEIPLCPYDSCRLLALNLYSYVEQPFSKKAYFNFEKFKEHVGIAQRLMDDLIDLEIEKIEKILLKIDSDPENVSIKQTEKELWEKIKEKSCLGRRTGLGITAEGDMLAALGIRYGTEEANEFSTEVHKQLAIAAYRSSVQMAKERGAFPIYNADKEKANPFIQRIKDADPELYEEMCLNGRRNIALLTIAPTGSVSLCTQTTSGIEPVFMIAYTRRRKVNPNDQKAKVAFVDQNGDSFEEYQVLHPKFKIWAQMQGYDPEQLKYLSSKEMEKLIEQSPYYKATAHDVDWVMKVKLQGAVQKWVDHSISVTVNIPENATESIVSKIYQTAWESQCKGMTIYREGSRDGVLVKQGNNNTNQNGKFGETNAPKRPKTIEAEVIRFKNKEEDWVAVVGIMEGRPYEIFTGKANSFAALPSWVKKGWVTRVKPSVSEPARYDFSFTDQDGYNVIIEGLSRMFLKEYWNYAKLISGILRHGMPLPNVVNLIDKLRLDDDNIMTWKNGVARALKRYIKEGTKIKQACPECKQESLVYKDGCVTCMNCGHSKCG